MRGLSVLMMVLVGVLAGCPPPTKQQQQEGAVRQAQVAVPVGAQGVTVEQQNVRDRLLLDNKPGSIKHLYVLSAYSGQCLIYSTVRGKVTSSGKRLQATTRRWYGERFDRGWDTEEIMQDDGTFGSSVEYLFWFDARGVYHQHYVAGGQIVHVSDQPLAVASVTINIEAQK